MQNYVFPLLNAEDIELRVGNKNKNGDKMTLLLYKTARTDAKYLDQVVGAFNWQKKFYSVNGFTICSLGIKDTETNEWVWKDDAGGESQIEKEKGTCSDAFKRSGFAWGIGRELYSAPTIWVDSKVSVYDLSVKEIVYNEKTREIIKVVIVDKDNNQVYPKGKVAQPTQLQEQPKEQPQPKTQAINSTLINQFQFDSINRFLTNLNSQDKREKWLDYIESNFKTKNIKELTFQQAKMVIDLMGQVLANGNK